MLRLSPVSYGVLVCVFKLEGFICVREEGDHMIFTKRSVLRPIVIPKYKNVPVFIIKNNMRSAGMTRERYFEHLARCR
jgi:predicted RNA binding protein YcfA (HicA-like mRNA interferase family)